MSGDEEDRSGGGAAAEDSEQDGKAQAKRPAKHEDLGAADLEKVTDFVEEAEMSGAANIDALKAMEKKRAEQQSAPQQQLPKVKLNKEDVELIIREMDVTRQVAERKLREHNGDVVKTLVELTESPTFGPAPGLKKVAVH